MDLRAMLIASIAFAVLASLLVASAARNAARWERIALFALALPVMIYIAPVLITFVGIEVFGIEFVD